MSLYLFLVAIFLLWQYLGIAAFAGLAIILSMMAINIYLTTQIKKLQVKQIINIRYIKLIY